MAEGYWDLLGAAAPRDPPQRSFAAFGHRQGRPHPFRRRPGLSGSRIDLHRSLMLGQEQSGQD